MRHRLRVGFQGEATSKSEGHVRRGVPVTPAEPEWMILHPAADATRASLQNGPDKRVPPKQCRGPGKQVAPKVGGACLSCPLRRDGSSNGIRRT